MKRTLIACAMMENEIKKVYEKTGCEIPVIWIDRGYHNTPKELQAKLQEIINGLQDQDEILLSFGLCGNGTTGLVSEKAVLVLPKFDDCINMMLCCGERKKRGLTEAGVIYLTRGGLMDEEAVLAKYQEYVDEYGEEEADDIMEMMYEHYKTIAVIDTESEDPAPAQEYARKAAELLDLSTETVKGSTKILEQLIKAEWDGNFIVQQPGQPLAMQQWDFPDRD